MYKLIIQDDEGKTTVVPLIREELTIGRQEGNTIRLTERNVSRRHAKLLRGQEAIIIEDLDSYNGVRVNGSRIQGKAEIKEADRVQIGDYLIEVKAEQPAGMDAPATEAETMQIPAIDASAPIPVATAGSEAVTAPNTAPGSLAEPGGANGVSGSTALGSDNYAAEATAAASISSAAPPTGTTPLADENGRLVILSTGMAGQDYELDKPAMVIGRTDENDICVNHRSISRHHAKVVRENSTYSVVDLHSANGVRVNGEEYGKVELRAGDLVDLGHVRFRYVAPGEDFLFGRDAHAVDIATEGKSNKALWAVLLLLVAGVIGFWAIGGEGDEKTGSGEQISKPGTDVPDKPDVNPIVDPDVDPNAEITIDAGTATVDDKGTSFAGHVEAALAARNDNDWATMGNEAKSALAIDPASKKANALAQQAEFEGGNQRTAELFQSAVADRKWAQVASHFANIDGASLYKVQTQPDHDRLKAEYAAFQVEAAEKAANRRRCAEIRNLASRVPSQWSDVARQVSSVKCTRPSSNTTVASRPDPDPVDPPKADGPPFEELLDQANTAVRDRQYGKGLKLCAQALEQRPNDQQAAMVCGIAACNLKKSVQAKKYLRRIRGASKKASLRQICIREEVAGFVD